MNKMKKHIVLILVLVIILVSILGILLYNREHDITNTTTSEHVLEIEDFKKKLEENEISIDEEVQITEASSIGAVDGAKFTIQGESIQVYRYDLNSSDELATLNIKNASENGRIILPQLDDLELTVIYNKGLILANFENHPDKEKIIDIFKSL